MNEQDNGSQQHDRTLMRILIVEDEEDIASFLSRGFATENFESQWVESGEEALELVNKTEFDAIILDVNLPGISGLEVCRTLRDRDIEATIIMLSAMDTMEDRVAGLKSGSDDYLVKPFAFDELLARLEAQERRRPSQKSKSKFTEMGILTYNHELRELKSDEGSSVLTEREGDLFELLLKHKNKPLTREFIFDKLWKNQGSASVNVVDVYMGYLRRKVADADPSARLYLRTVRGKGFMFNPPNL